MFARFKNFHKCVSKFLTSGVRDAPCIGRQNRCALRAGGIAGRGVLGRREGGKVGQGTARNAQRAGGRADVVEFCRTVHLVSVFVWAGAP